MNIFKKTFIIVFLIIAVTFIFLAVNFKYYGKDIVVSVLSKSAGYDVKIESVIYQFPFGLSLNNIIVENLLKAKKADVQVNPLSIFFRQIEIISLNLMEPDLRIEKKKQENQIKKETLPDSFEEPAIPSEIKPSILRDKIKSLMKSKPIKNYSLVIKKAYLKNGSIYYSNKFSLENLGAGNEQRDFSFLIKEVNLRVFDITLPITDENVKFELNAKLLEPRNFLSGTKIKSSGWMNFVKKDMDADFELVQQDNKGVLSASLKSKNNDLNVKGKISSEQIFKDLKKGDDDNSVPNLVLGALSNIGVKIGLDFSFNSKMDDFKIDSIPFSGSIIMNEK